VVCKWIQYAKEFSTRRDIFEERGGKMEDGISKVNSAAKADQKVEAFVRRIQVEFSEIL
jgi:hypothetical protein